MVSARKTALLFIWLVGLAHCQPRPPLESNTNTSGYEEASIEEEETQEENTLHRRRPPGHKGEATSLQGFDPTGYDVDNRQTGLTAIATALITYIIGFVRPLLTNLGIGATNALLATMLRRRIGLIPEIRKSITASATRSSLPSPTVRTL